MKQFHHLPETVEACRQTRDGRYMIITSRRDIAYSDAPVEVGSRGRIGAQGNWNPANPKPSPEAALASLHGIDRIRRGS